MIQRDDQRYSWTRQRMLQEIEALSICNKKLEEDNKIYLVKVMRYNKLRKKLNKLLLSLLN